MREGERRESGEVERKKGERARMLFSNIIEKALQNGQNSLRHWIKLEAKFKNLFLIISFTPFYFSQSL